MRLRNAIAWSLILSAIASAAFLVLTPPVDDFNAANPYWNGMSYVASSVGALPMPATGYAGMDPNGGSLAVMVVGPDMSFDSSYAYRAMSFAGSGGVLVVMDDFGTGNQLLASIFEGTGFGAYFSGAWLADPLYMVKSQYYPKAECAQGEVVMDYGTAIVGLSGDYTVLAWSSAFSYLDENRNGRHDAGEPEGPFPVAVEFGCGNGGRLVLVADSSVGINAVSGLEGNAAFIGSILEGRTVYIDTSHRSPSPFSAAKSAAVWGASLLYIPEVRYLAAIAGAFAIASVDWDRRAFKLRFGGGHRGRRKGSGSRSGDDMQDIYAEELERAAEEHPDWDYRTLERLAEERRRAGAPKGAE
jgi:hypothetical protein